MQISELMMKPHAVISEQDTLSVAAAKFASYNVAELPVVNAEGQLVGIIYRIRLLEALSISNTKATIAKKIIEQPPNVVCENDQLDLIFRQLPLSMYWVVNQDQTLVGMIEPGQFFFQESFKAIDECNYGIVSGKEMQLSGNNNLLISLLESFFDGIWISNGQGDTLYVNSSYERITGLKKEQLIGYNIHDLLKKDLFSQSSVVQVLKTGKPTSVIHNYVTGKKALATGNPIFNKSGEIVRVVCNIRDISELVELRNELSVNKKLSSKYSHELKVLRQQQMENLGFVAKSKAMENVVALANKVAAYDATVLLLGESGTGKEVLAKHIHQESPRSDKAFIKVNCAAIPETLIESELFGYVKGAFTGASDLGKPGMFELADQGTILLDEITELPLWIQSKLLRTIQEKEVFRIGDCNPMKLDVRIIATTNRSPEELVEKGELREDLFFRLNIVPIKIPLLQKRVEDIPALAFFFMKKQNERYKKQKTLSGEVISAFLSYHWPGNVRELENLIEHLFIISYNDEITIDLLPVKVLSGSVANKIEGAGALKTKVAQFEREIITSALKNNKSIRTAARELELDPSTLSRKIKALDIIVDA